MHLNTCIDQEMNILCMCAIHCEIARHCRTSRGFAANDQTRRVRDELADFFHEIHFFTGASEGFLWRQL